MGNGRGKGRIKEVEERCLIELERGRCLRGISMSSREPQSGLSAVSATEHRPNCQDVGGRVRNNSKDPGYEGSR